MSRVRERSVEVVDDAAPLLRIGELGRRAGVPVATLRAWERRYGIPAPRRGESGYRLYSRDDERRLRRMTDLIAAGLAPAEAARQATRPAAERAAAPDAGLVAGFRSNLATAFSDFDDRAANAVFDRAIAVLSIESLLDDVLLPVLRGLEADTIGQEHFASNLTRGRLLALARGWGGGRGPHAVLACPEGELHDLGLIAFGLALWNSGWRIGFLGANMPVEAILSVVEGVGPEVVVLSALTPHAFDGMEPDLARIGERTRLHLAGSGATDRLSAAVGASRLEQGPVAAAAALAA